MPPKKCASCTKTVFPVEELKCLDKIWHKFCFKCQVCNMTLNMKNYKGYDKLPYCNAHYPETKFTSVAETPESKRLAQNSKIQSNVKYHEEYEKEKGQYTSVADDPETLRVKKNMETISNASYHGDQARRQEMESSRPNEYEPSDAPPRSYHPPTSYQAPPASYTAQQQRLPQAPQRDQSQQPMAPPPQQGYGRRPGSINDYNPMTGHANSPYSSKPQSTTVYNSQSSSQAMMPPQQQAMRQPQQQQRVQPPQQRVSQPPASRDPFYGKGKVCRSMYDYAAADEDEIGFREADFIINCEPIDEGWMTGTVERTGENGMLPSNYVERVNW